MSFAIQVLAMVLSARAVEAQEAHFEILTIPPADVGTCLPPLIKAAPGERLRHGNRLVIKDPQPFMSRDISTFIDNAGQHTGLSDRTQVTTASLRSKGASVVATVLPNGTVTGFVTEITHTVPDSVLRAQDVAEFQKVYSGTGTSASRGLDSAEQSRVRSMIAFIRKRCP